MSVIFCCHHSKIQSKQKQIKQSNICEKVKFDKYFGRLERSFNKNSGAKSILLYVDKLARVLATWVKNLPVVDLQNFIFNVQSATATFKGI